MAALRLVEIRSSDDDRQSFVRKMRESVPELAAGYGIDTGGGFVKQ